MTHLFADLEPHVFHYLDDIVICSRTFEEHMNLLGEVSNRLRNANLTISEEKSQFCRREIKYLGYVLNEQGWTVDEEKIDCSFQYQPAGKMFKGSWEFATGTGASSRTFLA